jgi:uncharacterized membrane-anchored protein YhcB (DUF1043 family)
MDELEKKLEEWKQQFIDCFSPSTETRIHLETAYRDLKNRLGISAIPADPANNPQHTE